jgi:hypothetical protein
MTATTQIEPAVHSWQPVDLIGSAAAPPEPPTLADLAYPGRRHVYSGEPESLKSWAALVLAVEEIRKGESVLYVDLEMGRAEMLERLRDLGLSDDEIESRFLYVEPSEPLGDPAIRADVEALLQSCRPSLIVVDAFTPALELHGCDANSGTDIARFYRGIIELLRACGAAVLLLDHVTKSPGSRGKFSIGSERKIGGADVHLAFEVVRPFGRGEPVSPKSSPTKIAPGICRGLRPLRSSWSAIR